VGHAECRRACVFGEWLIVFNCSVLPFWNENKLPSISYILGGERDS
jgi:hypothetical protein